MPSHERQTIRLASPEDLVTIAAEHPIPTEWPPPDSHVEYTGPIAHNVIYSGGGLLYDVVADDALLPAAGFWWTTLGNVVTGSLADNALEQLLISQLAGQLLPYAGVASAYPVVIERNEGLTMKWLRTTYRGDLGGGVEHFQFHIDLGNPGADPDLSEADQLALAVTLAATFNTASTMMLAAMSADVSFVEVGVVQMEATTATNKDGTGGNAAQKNATAWSAYSIPSRPHGTEAGTPLPYEVATCVTFETAHRGPSGRGRIYLPVPGAAAMTAGGRFIVDHRNNSLTGTAALLTAIAEDTPYVPIVVSPRRLILNTINSVGVGSVPDSQRRRRRSQDEARLFTPVPA